MTNRVEFVKENLGSGSADWHRDGYNKQFKSILYLSDVKKGVEVFSVSMNPIK